MIITQTVQFFLILFIYHNSTDQPWFQNKSRDTIVLILSYLIFMLVPLFSWLFRPLVIKVTQESKLGKGVNVTPILIEDNTLKTPQTLRTISLSVEVKRRGSLWWRPLYWILLKNRVTLTIYSTPDNLLLQAVDTLQLKEVEVTETGFIIELNDLLKDVSGGYGSFSISKSYPYFIADHPEIHITHNLNAIIQPRIYVKDKPSWLLRLFIKYETNMHQVGFYRR